MKKINFQNLPSQDTPVNATNVNRLQDNIEEVFNGQESMGSIVVEDIKCKQLFNSSLFANQTMNGVTINVSKDGKINLSGTATSATHFKIPFLLNGDMLNKEYTINLIGTVTGISNVGLKINDNNISNLDETTIIRVNNGETNTTFTATQNFINNCYWFDIYISSGNILNSEFYIMIAEGNLDKVTSYIQYKNFNAPFFQDLTSEIVYNSNLSSATKTFTLYKYGNMLQIAGSISGAKLTANTPIFTIPAKYINGISGGLRFIFIGSGAVQVYVAINDDGTFVVKTDTNWLGGNGTWIIKDDVSSTPSVSTMSLEEEVI